jgi:multidrug resistance protein MdtO
MSADIAIDRAPWLVFLRDELPLRPGRAAQIARITICCVISVVICMVFRIPEAAYAAFLVFMVAGAETGITLMTAVAGAIAATAALLALSLVFFMLDAGEPALRLPLMAATTFLAMFLSRVIAIGPIAFLIGFLLVITQTLIDVIPSLEDLTHFVMWLWIVVMVPATLTLLAELAFGQSPARLVRDKALFVLTRVEEALRRGDASRLAGSAASTGGLVELRERADLVDHSLGPRKRGDIALIETLDELVRVARLMPSQLTNAARKPLADACASCREALLRSHEPSVRTTAVSDETLQSLDARARPVVLAAATVLDRLLAGLARRAAGQEDAMSAHEKEQKPFLIADAFSNPEHVRFALKSTLAVMLVYIFYSAVDWPGIRTCIVTCFFVALGSVGETVHKLTLRLSGAMAGGLLGLLCIVFVLPHVTGIAGLSVVVAVVAALGGWISTSSERLAYAGMQFAFAFYIGVLQGFGPTEELTVLRDRVLGILLGNIAMSVIFMTVWPVSAVTQAEGALAKAFATLAALLRGAAADARLGISQNLERARRLLSMGTFESGFVPGHAEHEKKARMGLADLDRLAAATFVVINQPRFDDIDATWRNTAAAWLESRGTTPVLDDAPVLAELATLHGDTPASLRAALESELVLSSEIRSATLHAA